MPVTVQCPNPACGKTATVARSLIGRAARCKYCGQAFPLTLTHDGTSRDTAAGGAITPAPAGPLPQRIGHYEIRARLGAGASGTVYRAYDPQLDREVALKVPNAGLLNEPKRVERFLREAKAAARLQHPNIVPVFDAGRDGGHYYIAAAFIDGRPLADAVGDGGLEFRRAARIVRALAEAVAYAHGQGVVHRDIKPANVMLDRADRPHLMDFGLAWRQDTADRLTHDGAVLGTPAYMAPEQAAGQQGEARPASDQYSLGVVLYELLTGRTPFDGPPPVVLYNVVNAEPPAVRSLRADIPRDLETVCRKAMAKRPDDRYPDCQELADDLRRWLENEPIAARRLTLSERLTRWVRKEPKLAASLLLAVTALALAAGVAAVSAARLSALAEGERRAKERADENASEARTNAELVAAEAEKARLAQRDAEEQRRTAEQREEEALRAKEEAEQARRLAETALAAQKQAESARRQAENSLEVTKNRLEVTKEESAKAIVDVVNYPAYISEAREQLGKRAYREAAQTLRLKCPDASRGWEWHYLHAWQEAQKEPTSILGLPKGRINNIRAISLSPTGDRLAIGYFRGEVEVWDVEKQSLLKTHDPGFGRPCWIDFSPDGTLIALASATQANGPRDRIIVIDSVSGATRLAIKESMAAVKVAFSPRGDRLLGLFEEFAPQRPQVKAATRLFRLNDGAVLFDAGPGRFSSFTPDGSLVFKGYPGLPTWIESFLHDPADLPLSHRVFNFRYKTVAFVHFNDSNFKLRAYDAVNKKLLAEASDLGYSTQPDHQDNSWSRWYLLDLVTEERSLLCLSPKGELLVNDPRSLNTLLRLPPPPPRNTSFVRCHAVSRDGRTVAVCRPEALQIYTIRDSLK